MFFDFRFLLFMAPAFLLAMLAQAWVSSAYASARRKSANLTGAQAARRILDIAGLQSVDVIEVPGHLSDHYDPTHRRLALSTANYREHTLAAVGIAAHEAGHAIQHQQGYMPLVIRNLAVPVANFGSGGSGIMLMLGVILNFPALIWLGVVLFSGIVFFQLVNLPVEFNASSRAKQILTEYGLVHIQDMSPIHSVLNAAALTYVAATLQSLLELGYYLFRFAGVGQSDE